MGQGLAVDTFLLSDIDKITNLIHDCFDFLLHPFCFSSFLLLFQPYQLFIHIGRGFKEGTSNLLGRPRVHLTM